MTARRDPEGFGHAAELDLVIDLAPHVEDFLGGLFGIAPMCGHCRRVITNWRRSIR